MATVGKNDKSKKLSTDERETNKVSYLEPIFSFRKLVVKKYLTAKEVADALFLRGQIALMKRMKLPEDDVLKGLAPLSLEEGAFHPGLSLIRRRWEKCCRKAHHSEGKDAFGMIQMLDKRDQIFVRGLGLRDSECTTIEGNTFFELDRLDEELVRFRNPDFLNYVRPFREMMLRRSLIPYESIWQRVVPITEE